MHFLDIDPQNFQFPINLSTPHNLSVSVYSVLLNNPNEISQTDSNILGVENKAEPVVESAAGVDLQTQKYENLIDDHEEEINQISVIDVDFSGWSVAKQRLQEICVKVGEAQTLDSEIDPVPDSAYKNAAQLLDKILVWGVSMPDIGWLTDGGIGFEWWSRDSKGIGTISVYGDNQVVYGTSGEVSSEPIKTKGTCPLSNFASLNDFRTKLLILCSQ